MACALFLCLSPWYGSGEEPLVGRPVFTFGMILPNEPLPAIKALIYNYLHPNQNSVYRIFLCPCYSLTRNTAETGRNASCTAVTGCPPASA